jgi:hypothetical protein
LADDSIAKAGQDFITKNNEILPDGVMRIGNAKRACRCQNSAGKLPGGFQQANP